MNMFSVSFTELNDSQKIYTFKIKKGDISDKTYHIFSCRYIWPNNPYELEFYTYDVNSHEPSRINILLGPGICCITTWDIYDNDVTEVIYIKKNLEEVKQNFKECVEQMNPISPPLKEVS